MSEEGKLREKFLNDYQDNIEKLVYEEIDIERIKTDDHLLNAYLEHNKFDIEKAVAFLHTSLEWRKSFNVKELSASSFPESLHESNVIFFYSRDKTGHKILHLQSVKMKKDSAYSDMVKRFLVWQIEQEFRANTGKRIVVLLDMCGAGLANVDINFIKFLISCFAANYPYMLEYLLIVDLPWILSAVWQLVKKWLTAEQQKFVLVVKQHELPKYIDKESLFIHLGGTKEMPKVAMTSEVFDDIKPINGDILDGNAASTTTTTTAAATTAAKRTISFAQTTKPAAESQTVKKDRMHPSMSENNILAVGSQTNLESNVKSTVKSVVVSPEDYLIYSRASDSDDASALITLQNKSPTPVAFKIKSTNPDAYRVKPVSGIVSPMSNAEIVVTLLAGKQMNTSNDRFQLVLVMVREKSAIDNLSTFWKNIPTSPDDFADHRYSCKILEKTSQRKTFPTDACDRTITNEEIMNRLNFFQNSIYIIIILLFAIILKLFSMANLA